MDDNSFYGLVLVTDQFGTFKIFTDRGDRDLVEKLVSRLIDVICPTDTADDDSDVSFRAFVLPCSVSDSVT